MLPVAFELYEIAKWAMVSPLEVMHDWDEDMIEDVRQIMRAEARHSRRG